MDGQASLFYRSAMDENCVAKSSCLFQGLHRGAGVRGEFGTDNDTFVSIHNHMKSCKTWKSVSLWESGVEYTIQHPDSDIVVADTNQGQRTAIFREYIVETIRGATRCNSVRFTIARIRREELDCNSRSYHDSAYKWVKIKWEKTFVYESERSSWRFHLAVFWEGPTKDEAERSAKRYSVVIALGSIEKASADAMYTTASFFEKMMDILFHKNNGCRQINVVCGG
ncbi:unnamed protein product [Pylaiella littoralis]